MDLKSSAFTSFFPIFCQVLRFGVVGACAAILHFSIVVGIVEFHWLGPLSANVIAFLIAFQVSYWGHRHWTFGGTTVQHRIAMLRLLLVAAVNLAANQAIFFIFLTLFKLPYMLALLITLVILPVVTFILGKFWIFR